MNVKDYPIWHPFTPQLDQSELVKIERGDGIYLIDEQGNKFIDAISSWWVNLHGHCNPRINDAVAKQLQELEHCLFSGFSHTPGLTLAKKLLTKLPQDHNKIFYSDDGSTAVEVGIKMVLQYWSNLENSKQEFIAFEGAYHGDTFGGMSVGERNAFNNAFSKLLFNVTHIEIPNAQNWDQLISEFEAKLQSGDIAGFIFEPLVQGAAGMRMYQSRYLDQMIELCEKHNVLTIADEVMTGFGRTGKFFASDYLEHKPDIICLSKGLTGGYMPLGVTSCHRKIHDAFVTNDRMKTFFHGHSYTGNPLACAAGIASFELMEEEVTWQNIEYISDYFLQMREKYVGNKIFKDVRCFGAIIAFEVNTQEQTSYLNSISKFIAKHFIKRNIIIRPLGNIFYLIPPYVISREELERIEVAVDEFVRCVV